MKLTEKQKLLKRLNAFCGMLGDDLKNLDAELLARVEDTKQRLGQSAKVAIGGLQDSNHRAIAEFLLGESLFRNAEEKDKCPLIEIRYGKEAKTHAIFGETRKTYPGLALSVALGGKTPDAIGIEVPNPLAADIKFVVLPSYDGDDNKAGYLVNLLDDTESIIWVSDANTPWQPKERRLWFTIPDTLKEHSVLALAGAENVTTDEAREALNEKRAFVAEDFCHHTPIFVDAAMAAFPKGKVADPTQFASSGGEALFKQITALVEANQAGLLDDARALRVELDKIPLGGSDPVPLAPLPAATPAASGKASTPADELKTLLLGKANLCKAAVGDCTSTDYAPVFEPMTELLGGIQNAMRDDLTLSRDQALMVTQVDEACELVGLLSYENNEKAAQEAADTVRQIVSDVWARLPNDAADNAPNSAEIEKFSAAS